MLNKDTLYDKAVKEGVPFFQWHSWIEKIINKEVLSKILSKTTTPAPTNAAKNASLSKDIKDNKKPSTSVKETLLKMQAAAKEKETAEGTKEP